MFQRIKEENVKYLKLLMITFLLLIFVFVSGPGYCFFRDDADHERIIREVEEKRRESKEKLKESQAKKELERKERIRIQEQALEETKPVEKIPGQSRSKVGIMVLLILCLGLGGYLFYRRKR